MRLVYLSLGAGLLAATSSTASAHDISTWRWHVSQVLREQQAQDDVANAALEARAAEVAPAIQQQSDLLYSSYLTAAAASQRADH